jgi:hypothetical protein
MDFLKEYLDGFFSRIRSHLFASFAFSFFAFNWKLIYVLLFSDAPVEARLLYVELNSSSITSIGAPLAVGGMIAICFPYLNWGSAYAVSWAITKHRLLQVEQSVALKRKKLETEIAMIELESKRNQHRDQARAELERELASIEESYKSHDSNTDQRARLLSALDEEAGLSMHERSQILAHDMTPLQRNIVKLLGAGDGEYGDAKLLEALAGEKNSLTKVELSPPRLKIEYLDALRLLDSRHIVQIDGQNVKLTALGFKVSDWTR